jgi:toxin ParE1/3/4
VTRRLRIAVAAVEELEAAAAWYEERAPGLGGELLGEIQRALDLVSRHPHVGAPVPRVPVERGTRRVPLNRFPYSVVYRVRGDEIEVVAFAHQSRNPGYWRSR